MTAKRFFAKKYLKLLFKDTIIQRLKNLYHDQLCVQHEVPTAEAFAGKKQGQLGRNRVNTCKNT